MLKIKAKTTNGKTSSGLNKNHISITKSVSFYRLHKLAFDNSLQANIITNAASGKIVIANSAACKLFGYSKKELITKSRGDIFDINESSFKKMLKQRRIEGKSAALVTVIKKTGKSLACEITSAVFMNEDGIENAVYTISGISQNVLKQKEIDAGKEKIITDNVSLAKLRQKNIASKKEKIIAGNIVLAQAKSDARLAENNEWIKYIAKTSYDVMWDWDIATGQIYVGDSIEEVFGYKVQNNTVNFTDFILCLLPEEKDAVEKKLLKALASHKKNWNDSYMLKRNDGSVASTNSRASIVRDEKGKAIRMIGAVQDISNLHKLEKKLEEEITMGKVHSEKFLMASKLSFDGIWDWNLLTNEIFLGEGFKELVGYDINKNEGDIVTNWTTYLHPDDKEVVEKGLSQAIASPACYWELVYRFMRADGSIAKVFNRASILRDSDGKACRIIGAMQDISKQKVLEERLEQEIRLKEKNIAKARAIERSDLGKELHDNVNQLLGASRLYLNMAKRGGENSEMFLSRSSEYTLTAIEEIRKLTKGLTTDAIKNRGLCESIENVTRDMMEVNPVEISCELWNLKEDMLNEKFKLNVFRIVQEQLNNIVKHANANKVTISLSQNKKSIMLTVSDNGMGFDIGKKRKGIGSGIDNIKSRVASYNGTVDFVSKPGEGCTLNAGFPITNELLHKNRIEKTFRYNPAE